MAESDVYMAFRLVGRGMAGLVVCLFSSQPAVFMS